MEIIDFSSESKNLPVDKDKLANKLSEVPLDLIREYVNSGLETARNHMERMIALFHSINGPFFHEFLDQFNEEELKSLNNVADYLNDKDLLNKIDELVEASYNKDTSNKNVNKYEKVNVLLELLKNLGEDGIKIFASKLVPFCWDINRLSKLLLFYLEKIGDEEAVSSHLRIVTAQDIDKMISDINQFKNIFKDALEIKKA